MPIAQLTLHLRLPLAGSLKDRRNLLRSVKQKLRNTYNISVAELDEVPTSQNAILGVVAISSSRDLLRSTLEQVDASAQAWATQIGAHLGAEIVDSWWDFVD